MGLVLKNVIRTSAGTFHYRRRIPKDVQDRIGKGEFKRLLGESEREALRNFPKVNAEFEKLVADARKPERLVINSGASQTPLDIHREARRRATELASEQVAVGGRTLSGDDPEASDLMRDLYLESLPYDRDTGEPIGGSEVEGKAYGILASGGRLPRPAPTLADAKRLYVEERIKGDRNERQKLNQLELVMRHVEAAELPLSRPLNKLTREDGRNVRDYLLLDLGISASSAARYINVIRAVVSLGLTEFEVADGKNPFVSLSLRVERSALEERSPMPDKLLPAIRFRIENHGRADLWKIWRIVEGTGCRLGEVAGLMVEDVNLDHRTPYINLVPHAHRGLKNVGSQRRVPLIGDALEAAREAVRSAEGSPVLFSRYGRLRGSDSCSQILMRHIRKVTSDPKITVHSLRHRMEDKMMSANISEFDRNLVLGHSTGSMGERYGGPDARLEAAARAIRAALGLTD